MKGRLRAGYTCLNLTKQLCWSFLQDKAGLVGTKGPKKWVQRETVSKIKNALADYKDMIGFRSQAKELFMGNHLHVPFPQEKNITRETPMFGTKGNPQNFTNK